MKLKAYLEKLNKYVEQNPEVLECEAKINVDLPEGISFCDVDGIIVKGHYQANHHYDGYVKYGRLLTPTEEKPLDTVVLGIVDPPILINMTEY